MTVQHAELVGLQGVDYKAISRHIVPVIRTAGRDLLHLEDDIIAETVYRLFRAVVSGSVRKSVLVMAKGVCRNVIREMRRSEKKSGTSLDAQDSDDGVATDVPDIKAEEKMVARDTWLDVMAVVERALNDREQKLFELAYLEELSTKQIARELNLAPGTCRVALSRLRDKLRNDPELRDILNGII